jgi:hypothetical protein
MQWLDGLDSGMSLQTGSGQCPKRMGRAHFWVRGLVVFSIIGSVLCNFPSSYLMWEKQGIESSQHVLPSSLQNFQQPTEQHILLDPPAPQDHNNTETLSAMIDALNVMQEDYFELWQGIWPTAIDWTAAVLGTYLSAALSTLSSSADHILKSPTIDSTILTEAEDLIGRYFSHLISFYFGQDALAIRSEAYDDMLWVVLGWLEAVKFVDLHSSRNFKIQGSSPPFNAWYGEEWSPGFAHRARIFWDLASKGWNESLCGGGMIWNPYLTPYKNAITNELFVAASISMYLYFPGDDNPSPFLAKGGVTTPKPPIKPHDPRYLEAAVVAYRWLSVSNMTNDKGLYVDGYHIKGYDERERDNSSVPTKCDERNDMVYTYNQGVLLSGQRGLWEATGARSYLEDGHKLISSVISATGYNLANNQAFDEAGKPNSPSPQPEKWHGIGRAGILEDACDSHGDCSQDGQTFKGIFFHHLTAFCAPLPSHFLRPEASHDVDAFQLLQTWHTESCASYGGWIKFNARAAVKTRDTGGKYGAWWGAPASNDSIDVDHEGEIPDDAVDYRNKGIPDDSTWRRNLGGKHMESQMAMTDVRNEKQQNMKDLRKPDVNDRGRGRTVETQGGGVAVLRALWEIVDLRALDQQV